MESLLIRLQRALAGRYAVEHELGRGGMATVFLGHDQRLERRVAIKVFEKEGGLISAGERFLREIRFAAQLQHPNILPVHDSGEGEGLVYYVMPYVAGGSVRERLEREGPLPVGDAVRIAREVAEALDHAHRAGIVHRDIKPDNIMLADGVAVVADFGIARAIEQGGGKVTDTGLAIGTPTYMSPEQASASPQIDGRTDIYALGCVLYEMLAGAPPFGGTTAQQVMARHATDAAPPLSTVRRVPPALEAAIQKALAKLPGDRWSTGKAFAEVLSGAVHATSAAHPALARTRRLGWIAAAVVLVLVVAALVWRGGSPRGAAVAAAEPMRSVAVLPVRVLDTALAASADGMTEAVITGLVRLQGLRVPSSNRVFALRDPQADVRALGRKLAVEAVLVATLQQAGGTLRLNVQLVNVSDGLVLWSDRYDGETQDVFAMQDNITGKIVDAFQLKLAPGTRAALARGARTRDTVAYRLYLEARRAIRYDVTKQGLERAATLFERALQRDSMFADAWLGLYDVLLSQYGYGGVRPLESAVARSRAVERAIELDSLNGTAFAYRAEIRYTYYWDWDGAWRDMRRAVQLSPASADAATTYAVFLNWVNEPDSALRHMRRAVTLDPTASYIWTILGNMFAIAGMRDSALRASEHARILEPDNVYANWVQMNAYFDAGRRADADSAAERMRRFGSDQPVALAFVASYYRRIGNRLDAQEILDSIVALERHQYVPSSAIATARLAVGDRPGALDALEEAALNRDPDLAMHFLLSYSSLRGEPRYEAVARKVFGGRPVPRNPFP